MPTRITQLENPTNETPACEVIRENGDKPDSSVRLEGLHLFIEKVVELAEECEKAVKYLPKGEDAA